MSSLITMDEFKSRLNEIIGASDIKEVQKLINILNDPNKINSEYHTKPGHPNIDLISSTTESAFQRAIFNKGESYLHYRKDGSPTVVRWQDLEIPVVLGRKSRRTCIDLIGSTDGTPVICELKYMEKSVSDHPKYAIFELLIYFYLIRCNFEKLDKNNVHHQFGSPVNWKMIANNFSTQLIVAANSTYWNYWLSRLNLKDLIEYVFYIVEELDINLHLFQVLDPVPAFKMQKMNSAKYKPVIEDNHWHKIKYEPYHS